MGWQWHLESQVASYVCLHIKMSIRGTMVRWDVWNSWCYCLGSHHHHPHSQPVNHPSHHSHHIVIIIVIMKKTKKIRKPKVEIKKKILWIPAHTHTHQTFKWPSTKKRNSKLEVWVLRSINSTNSSEKVFRLDIVCICYWLVFSGRFYKERAKASKNYQQLTEIWFHTI